MKKAACLFIGILVFISYSFPIHADEVILDNGDRISGTVVKANEDSLTIETGYSDPVSIKRTKIKSLNTVNPVSVHLLSGEILKGRLSTDAGGRIIVQSSADRADTSVAWDNVAALNPPKIQPVRWKGSIAAGGSLQSGNTSRTAGSISAEGTRKTDQDRYSMRFQFNYAEEDGEKTARNTYGALKYDYFFTEKLYSYLSIELLSDEFKDLNLRTIVGPGIGYQYWDDSVKFLNFEAGLAYFSEDLDEGVDDQWLSCRFASTFKWNITDSVSFSDYFAIYPNCEDFDKYQIRNEAGLNVALGSDWSLKLTNIIEHDSKPPVTVEKTDVYWVLGLQYSFY